MITAKDLKVYTSSLTVLYVEDEEWLRNSMQGTLQKLFKQTLVASNGQEALDLFKKESIDLIITDINMPIMNGVELIESVKKERKEDPMLVVLSAHNESEMLTKLINLSIDQFINKPLDKQIMIDALFKVCRTIHDRQFISTYDELREKEIHTIQRKSKILEHKLNQLAAEKNKNIVCRDKKNLAKDDNKDTILVQSDYYENLIPDDKDELKDLSIELDNFALLMIQNEKINTDYITKISNAYQKYASILNSYQDFYDIGEKLILFSQCMLQLEEKFMKDINQTGVFLESLQVTLNNFIKNVWDKKIENPQFYNASLTSDIQLVINFLEDKEEPQSSIDFF